MTHTTSEVLNLAADLIEKRGWTQGPNGWHVAGPQCVLGALCNTTGVRAVGNAYAMWEGLKHPAVAAVASHLNVTLDDLDGHEIYEWNDHPDRTAAEVIEVLRAAAVIEAARENASIEVSA